MNQKMKIIREVNNQAELFYNDAIDLGDHAAYALKKAHRAQMTSLENIAESTLKTTDVFDYIKKQIARYEYWQKSPRERRDANEGFGERLRNYLETKLPERIITVSNAVGIGNDTDEDKQKRREIYLLLMRQFIRQVVVQYEYRANQENQGREA